MRLICAWEGLWLEVLIEASLVMLLSTSTAGWAGTDQYGSIRL